MVFNFLKSVGINSIFGYKLRSSDWPTIRKEHVKKHPFCIACGTTRNIEVHHVKPYQIHPELELEPTNLVSLCKTHHLVFGHLTDYHSWNENVVEDSNWYLQKVKNKPKAPDNKPKELYRKPLAFFEF
jgi:5-methylcytosine-specific restriction endonuclease McrA